MLLGVGPVMRYELITTARRGRYYLARVVYGLVLLVTLNARFAHWEAFHPQGGTPEELRSFAESAFIDFGAAQGIAFLALVPVLVAGVIADEHQRKTLHYLLASRLSSFEIVLGKFGARLVHIAAFAALGLPAIALLSLFGGINPENVMFVYGGTASTSLMVAGFSMLISIMANRPRDAILAAYLVEAFWLFGPIALRPFADSLRGPLWWMGPASTYALLTNPVTAWWQLTSSRPNLWATWLAAPFLAFLHTQFYFLVGTQTAITLLCLALSVLALRPLRGNSWPGGKPGSGWASALARRARTLLRAPVASPLFQNQLLRAPTRRRRCDDDPLLWKERYTATGGGLRWLSTRAAVLVFSVALGCYLFDAAHPVLMGSLRGRTTFGPKLELNEAVRFVTVVLAALAMLAIASGAAASMTGEREGDTWISLATTLVTPLEVIRAKQIGCMWGARRIMLAMTVFWTSGWLLNSIDLLGLIGAAATIVASAWFVAALGVLISIGARTTTRALVATVLIVLVMGWYWPAMVWFSLVSDADLEAMRHALGNPPGPTVNNTLWYLGGFAVAIAAYVGGAAILTLWAIRRLRTNWCPF
jgi:ABC-type transport system involved in multi-copper enzyme maturation permease subunit